MRDRSARLAKRQTLHVLALPGTGQQDPGGKDVVVRDKAFIQPRGSTFATGRSRIPGNLKRRTKPSGYDVKELPTEADMAVSEEGHGVLGAPEAVRLRFIHCPGVHRKCTKGKSTNPYLPSVGCVVL